MSVFLIRSCGAPNGTEVALLPSVMIRFGPHWHHSKITWANLVNALLDLGTEKCKHNNVNIRLPFT